MKKPGRIESECFISANPDLITQTKPPDIEEDESDSMLPTVSFSQVDKSNDDDSIQYHPEILITTR